MEKIKNFFISFLQNFSYDIVKHILLVIFTSGFSFRFIFYEIKKYTMPFWSVIMISISITTLFSFIIVCIYQFISNKYFHSKKIKSKYTILNKTVSFTYNGEISNYESEITILFNEKAREFYGKFYWSGSGNATIKPTNHNYTLNILKQRTQYIEYVVIFDKTFRKGKKLTFKLKGVMHDPDRKASPYFATTINVPTKKLKITLNIDPEKYPIKDLEKEIVLPCRFDHENCEPICLDDEGTYVWNINNPKISYQYSLNWCFTT